MSGHHPPPDYCFQTATATAPSSEGSVGRWFGPCHDKYLGGPLEGSQAFSTLQEAQRAAMKLDSCSGITKGASGEFSLRAPLQLVDSPTHETSWIKLEKGDCLVTVKTQCDKLLTVNSNGKICGTVPPTPAAYATTMFVKRETSPNRFALLSVLTGKYVAAEDDHTLTANRVKLERWEILELIGQGIQTRHSFLSCTPATGDVFDNAACGERMTLEECKPDGL
ncbi:hypothetical protein Pelo_7004 [Pelomyxa schiedti]|nr:hypothetical protein Pelo_7004 [Pelomyxa schiedti]